MNHNVTCPSCHHKYWIPEGEMGSRQTCPHCQTPFFAGASVSAPRGSAPAAALQAGYAKTIVGDMAPPIKYNCPRCKAPLEAPASEAGMKINCPSCTQRLQVPAAPPPPAPPAPNLNKTMVAGDESAAPPRPPIKYNCPSCKKPLEAPAEQGGTKRNCPHCSQRLQIPAAPAAAAANRNKTMLASDESVTPAGAAPGVAWAGAAGAGAAAAGPGSAVNPWAAYLTPKNVIIGVLALLLLLFVVPAVLRGGKEVDKEALTKAQQELEKLKHDIELKQKEKDLQAKEAEDARKRSDDMLRARAAEDDRRRAEDQRRLSAIDDEEEKARTRKKFALEQQQRDRERQGELERKNAETLAEFQRKLQDTQKALEESKQKAQSTQTIIQQPPVITYPPYNPYYYRPYWW